MLININSNEPTCYPYSININDSYAKLCVPDVINNIMLNYSIYVNNE